MVMSFDTHREAGDNLKSIEEHRGGDTYTRQRKAFKVEAVRDPLQRKWKPRGPFVYGQHFATETPFHPFFTPVHPNLIIGMPPFKAVRAERVRDERLAKEKKSGEAAEAKCEAALRVLTRSSCEACPHNDRRRAQCLDAVCDLVLENPTPTQSVCGECANDDKRRNCLDKVCDAAMKAPSVSSCEGCAHSRKRKDACLGKRKKRRAFMKHSNTMAADRAAAFKAEADGEAAEKVEKMNINKAFDSYHSTSEDSD